MRRLGLVFLCASVLLMACGHQKEKAGEGQTTTSSRQVKKSSSSKKLVDQSSKDESAASDEKDSEQSSSSEQSTGSDKGGDQKEARAKASAKSDDGKKTKEESKASSTPESSSAMAQNLPPNGLYHSVQGKYGEVIIVNKKHPLAPGYGPGENPTAQAAFWQLVGDMRAKGFSVSDAYSGFRSYDYQASLYQNYVNRDGQAAADRYSARPGYSEHQTGLAFDLIDGNGALLQEPGASHWLANNAHHYGFVVRYLPGKEHITGYMPESWHIRYIGPEATAIYQSGLTLEEYYGVEGGGYK